MVRLANQRFTHMSIQCRRNNLKLFKNNKNTMGTGMGIGIGIGMGMGIGMKHNRRIWKWK